MSSEAAPHVAMVGMYGGMWREFNPGCFMIAHKTKRELEARIAGVDIDIYSIDNRSRDNGLDEVTVGDMAIKFFSRAHQLDLLDGVISDYDAVVMGGDIIWGGDDVVPDNDIFFLESEKLQATQKPIILFNAVHTFYDDESIIDQRERITSAAERASYLAVRTPAVQNRLARLGLHDVVCVPDPVLDLDMSEFPDSSPVLPTERDKPFLGISIRNRLSDAFVSALRTIDTSGFDVVVLPFSRQYDNLEALKQLKTAFGNDFHYIPAYLDPVKSYQLVGELDLFLNDTYHGVIASIIHDKPFVSLDVEPERTSRKQQLLESIGLSDDYNIRLGTDATQNSAILSERLPALLAEPIIYDAPAINDARRRVQAHFDAMAGHIRGAVNL